MARTIDKFELQAADRKFLVSFTQSGTAKAREIKRGLALLKLDAGFGISELEQHLGISKGTLYSLRRHYHAGGLEAALYDKARSGRPPEILSIDKAKITALACSEAPPGHVRWTLRLLADKAVELGYVEKGNISHTWISDILKKTNLNRI